METRTSISRRPMPCSAGKEFPLPLSAPGLSSLQALWGGGWARIFHASVCGPDVIVSAAALTFEVGRLLLDEASGCSFLAAAVSGGLLIYEHYVLTESLFTMILSLAVFLYL